MKLKQKGFKDLKINIKATNITRSHSSALVQTRYARLSTCDRRVVLEPNRLCDKMINSYDKVL